MTYTAFRLVFSIIFIDATITMIISYESKRFLENIVNKSHFQYFVLISIKSTYHL